MRRRLWRPVVVLLLAAPLLLPAAAEADQGTYWQRKGCDHGHRSTVAYKRISVLLKNTSPVGQVTKQRAGHYARCVATRAKAHAVHEHARRIWRWRHAYAQRWRIAFNRLPAGDKAWAYSTGACESGNNPATNTGNGFSGAFQFVISTWRSAGGTGVPHQHSWAYQAVIAVKWMHIAGRGQWPVCG